LTINEIKDKIKSLSLNPEEKKRADTEIKELKYYEIKTGNKIEDMIEKGNFNKDVFIWFLLGFIEENPLKNNIPIPYIQTDYKMPDIDIDLGDSFRNKIIQDLEDIYGKKKVATISTFSKYSYKMALKDIFRIFGIPAGLSNQITKKLGDEWEKQLENEVEKIQPFLEKVITVYPDRYKTWKDVYNDIVAMAKDMDSQIRQQSVHASGVLISSEYELDKHIPIKYEKKSDSISYSTEWDLHNLEDNNYLKLDLLGLRTLSIIQETVDEIKLKEGIEIDVNEIDDNNPELYKTIEDGWSDNIFQLGTDSGVETCKIIKPKTFEDIVAITSLNRPSTKGLIKDYKDNKPSNVHEIIDKNVKKTNGVILFQEQINRILAEFLDIEEGEADLIRRNLEKNKNPEDLKKVFMEKSSHDELENEFVFNYLLERAGYLFNKCLWEEQIINNKKLKDYEIGDKIKSFNFVKNIEEEQEIIEKSFSGINPVFEIIFENGTIHYPTPNHKYEVIDIINNDCKVLTIEEIIKNKENYLFIKNK